MKETPQQRHDRLVLIAAAICHYDLLWSARRTTVREARATIESHGISTRGFALTASRANAEPPLWWRNTDHARGNRKVTREKGLNSRQWDRLIDWAYRMVWI